jgi:hypothetical protein
MLSGIGHLCARQCEEEKEKRANELATACNKVISHSVVEAVGKW